MEILEKIKDLDDQERKTYIWIAIAILVVATTGFLLWRVNQDRQLSSEESEAADTVVCGGICVNDTDCIGWDDGSGDVECKTGVSPHTCQVYRCPEGYIIGPKKCSCIPPEGIACGDYGCYSDEDCEGGTGPNLTHECAQRVDGDMDKQQCIRISCPTEYIVGEDKCSCVLETPNVCDGGGWIRKPTSFEEDENFTLSGYGEDTDGIDEDSIVITLDGDSISSYKITKQPVGDKVNWSTTLSNLNEGNHTITVSWEDSKGQGGEDCTVSTTFSVLGIEEEDPPTEEQPTSTPQTGIMDESSGKIILGFVVLVIGFLLRKVEFFKLNWSGVQIRMEEDRKGREKESFRNDFEKKVVKDN